jgi:hypothetical protein
MIRQDTDVAFDIFLQRFEGGDAADANAADLAAVLDPLVEARGPGWARIQTSDGAADVYGTDNLATGVMVNHASGRAVWDVLFELARAGRLAVMPVGCPTCVIEAEQRADLPPELQPEAVEISSGDELFRIVT